MKPLHRRAPLALAWLLAVAATAAAEPTTPGEAGTAPPARTAPTAAPAAAPPPIWWQPPAQQPINWRGMLATDGSSVGSGAQFGPYPVAGAGGLLVAVLTHAAISQGAQSAERQRAQEAADQVLAPYRASLQAWPAERLWAASATLVPGLRLWTDDAATPPGARIETVPVYTLSQDGSALQLDLAVKWTPAAASPPRVLTVRVVSAPQTRDDAHAHWQADDAAALKASAAALLAHAVQLAVRHAETPPAPHSVKTHRYLHGRDERAERAERLEGDCARAVLRNLRGWLVSVPLQQAEPGACTASTALPAPGG